MRYHLTCINRWSDCIGYRIEIVCLIYSYFPLLEFASPASEISTVPHPSSADKSIPSTMLTSRGLSSISSSGNFTGNDGTTASAHTTTNSTRSLRQKSSAEMTPLGTIPEQSYGELEFPLPSKGQLISKCLFDFFEFSKKPMTNLTNFCPRM